MSWKITTFLEHFPNNNDDDDDMRDIILCAGSVNRVEGVCGKHLVSLRLGRRQTDRVNLCGSKRKSSFDSQCLLSTKASEEGRLTKQGVPILQSRTCRSFFSTLIWWIRDFGGYVTKYVFNQIENLWAALRNQYFYINLYGIFFCPPTGKSFAVSRKILQN